MFNSLEMRKIACGIKLKSYSMEKYLEEVQKAALDGKFTITWNFPKDFDRDLCTAMGCYFQDLGFRAWPNGDHLTLEWRLKD